MTTPATQTLLPVTPEPAIRWQGTEDEQHAARMKVCTERCALYNDDDCDRDGSCSECDVDMALELETPASLRHRLAYWQGRAATAESQAHSLPGTVEQVARALWIFDNSANISDVELVWDDPEKTQWASYWVGKMESNRPRYLEMARAALAALTPSAPEPVQKLHELPPGEYLCRHCEGKDPHCSVCDGVGSLPSHQGAGDADV